MTRATWKRISDNRVIHVWIIAENDVCDEGPITVIVSPDWYQNNGTPICPSCGQDMVYDHTEVLTPRDSALWFEEASNNDPKKRHGPCDCRKGSEPALRHVLQSFALEMEQRLLANDHKGGWGDKTPSWLLERCVEEIEEAKRELASALDQNMKDSCRYEAWSKFGKECADAANFLMMAYDLATCPCEVLSGFVFVNDENRNGPSSGNHRGRCSRHK